MTTNVRPRGWTLGSRRTMLGHFEYLPDVVRRRIWEFYLVPELPKPITGHKRRQLALLSTCHGIRSEMYPLLYGELSLTFTIGIPYCTVDLPVPPSGIEIDDGRGAPFAFISSNGPQRSVSSHAKFRWHKILASDRPKSINFVIRGERAGDVSYFLRTWFEALQLADLIESLVPPWRHIEVSFHTTERHVGDHQYDATLGVAPHLMPDEIAQFIRNRPMGLLMYPFLMLYFQRTTRMRLNFIGQQWRMRFDPQSEPGRLSPDTYHNVLEEYKQRVTVVSLWLYQKVVHIQGRVANFWRLDMFANWHNCFNDFLVAVHSAPSIPNLAAREPEFLRYCSGTVGLLYYCMRAHNPMSYWQKYNIRCPQFCCGGNGNKRTCDDWSRDEWYKRYPFGIESSDSPAYQFILSKWGDRRLKVSLGSSGLIVTDQTHPLVASETKTVRDLDSVLYLADEYAVRPPQLMSRN